jgi:ABC-type ATPase with predicted acetyltransferase domain
MQNFDIVKTSDVKKTFRVEAVLGMFGMDISHSNERFQGEIDLDWDWNVGLIVGPSGSGKSTIANEIFSKEDFFSHEYKNNSILDEFPKNLEVSEIIKILTSVGFSSPPCWLKPYSVLSNGEKMRIDIALSLSQKNKIVFDEFTSVVDRDVAKIASFAISKFVKRNNKQFVGIACHYDIIDWLETDWIFDTKEMKFYSRLKKKDQSSNLKLEKLTNNIGIFLKNITI